MGSDVEVGADKAGGRKRDGTCAKTAHAPIRGIRMRGAYMLGACMRGARTCGGRTRARTGRVTLPVDASSHRRGTTRTTQNWTFGASRTCSIRSAGIASWTAGAKLNMPAMTLEGNTSRLLLKAITASLKA